MYKTVFLILILTFTVSCQDFGNLKILASLPNHTDEVSGIEVFSNSTVLWMVQDSGNKPLVYGFNTKSGKADREIKINNAKNKDWEDLASDGKNTLYIGDFGNNNNKRKDLTIYTIIDVLNNNNSAVNAIKTNFYFEDQKDFPPKKKHRNFDVEAFIYLNNNFYLFTRNRARDFDGTTKVYKVPASEGNYAAKLIAEYKTCDKTKDCAITSASIDHKTGKIALLSNSTVWILTDYSQDNFFNGKIETIPLNYRSQLESISFKDSNTLWLVDERYSFKGGNLYELSLNN